MELNEKPEIAILQTSRNNYEFLRKYWIPKTKEFKNLPKLFNNLNF